MLDIIEVLDKGGNVPQGTLDRLVSLGILPLSFKTHLKMYYKFCEYYKELLDNGDNSPNLTALTLTADDFSVTEMTVRRAINKMESII